MSLNPQKDRQDAIPKIFAPWIVDLGMEVIRVDAEGTQLRLPAGT